MLPILVVAVFIGINATGYYLLSDTTQVNEQAIESLPPVPPVIAVALTNADKAVKDTAVTILGQDGTKADPVATTPTICGQTMNEWFTAEGANSANDSENSAVTVAAYTAGKASQVYANLEKGAKTCTDVNTTSGKDVFTATVSNSSVNRVIGVKRLGDVLLAANVASFNGNAESNVTDLLSKGTGVINSKLLNICADPGSNTTDTTGRDPFQKNYKGYQPAIKITLDTPSQPIPAEVLAAVASLPTDPTWKAPEATLHSELAPYVSPTYGDTIDSAKRQNAPKYVDPNNIPTPSGTEPKSKPAKPKEPATPAASVTTTLPAEDKIGPGCGWEFTSRTAPKVDTEQIQQDSARQTLNTLGALNRAAGVNLVTSLTYPGAQRGWADQMIIWNNWQKYRQTSAVASEAAERAQEIYEASLQEWTKPLPTPKPTPSKTPDKAAEPTPSNSPSSEPSVNPDETPNEGN